MGIAEVALLLAAQQFAQAAGVYLAAIQGSVTNPYGAAGIKVGMQIAANIASGIAAGLSAANAEFSVTNTSEATVAKALAKIPPIT